MNIQQQVSLSQHSTMGLGGTAAYLTSIESKQELLEAYNWAQARQLPVIIIGSGSNIVWRDEGFPGLVVVNHIEGYEVIKEDGASAYITVGAGEIWDTVVERTVQAGLSGIEALSLIPGTTGATPVQNVGAYGQEISQTLVTVEVLDTQTKTLKLLRGDECGFAYRTSRFKTSDRGRYFIVAITLHLQKTNPQPPYYASVQTYLEEHNIAEVTPTVLREAVIAIRQSRLPDPGKVRNNGSFFANPIIKSEELANIRDKFPNIPAWQIPDGSVKLPAAWLIERAGFKDYHDEKTGMATWPAQPLVLINEKAKSTADLLTFRQKIIDSVATKFGITLQQEPELLP